MKVDNARSFSATMAFSEADPILEAKAADSLWQKYTKTILINISFLALGVCEAIRGPTLLDLQDVYETDLESISLLFLAECVGSLIGSFLTGYLLNRYPQWQNAIVFVEMSLLALSTALTPFAPNLNLFFFLLFFVGLLLASVHTGGNVICLDMWSGTAGGVSTHIHSIHFCYAFGAFVAPMVAAPFLSAKSHHVLHGQHNATLPADIDNTDSRIATLFPLIGIATFIMSLGYLFYGVKDCQSRGAAAKIHPSGSGSGLSTANGEAPGLSEHVLVVVFSLFIFLYVGTEYCFGTYLTEFAVECKLHLTRADGAALTALFWGAFSLMRFFAVVMAYARVRPTFILVFSFFVCFVGSAALVVAAEQTYTTLRFLSCLMGFGMGTVFATGMAWLEDFLVVDGGLGGVIVVAGTIGPDIFPVVVGQFLDKDPMILVHVQFATVSVCIGLFLVAVGLSTRVKRNSSRL